MKRLIKMQEYAGRTDGSSGNADDIGEQIKCRTLDQPAQSRVVGYDGSDPVPEHTARVRPARPRELTAPRSPLPALTGIRFLAAMYVVFYHSHFSLALEQRHWFVAAQFIRNGLLAVPLFFMLSGFILSYTYAGQIGRPNGYRRFWEARFARVWPLYAISLVLSTIVDHTTPNSIIVATATLLMAQSWNPFNVGMASSWNFVCWTLSVEAFFYLLFPLLQRWLDRLRTRALLLLFGIVVAIATLGKTGGINYSDLHGLRYIPLALWHFPEFVVGVCAGNLFVRNRVRQIAATLPGRGMVTAFIVFVCLFLLCSPLLGAAAWTALGFPVLLFCLAGERSTIQRFLSTRVMIVAGQISFGVYLLQWPCKTAINLACGWFHIESASVRFVIDCIALILLSAATFYGVEEPSRRLIRSLFARKEKHALDARIAKLANSEALLSNGAIIDSNLY